MTDWNLKNKIYTSKAKLKTTLSKSLYSKCGGNVPKELLRRIIFLSRF